MRWIAPQTKWRLPCQLVQLVGACFVNTCDRAHYGPICGFLVFKLQIAIDPFAL